MYLIATHITPLLSHHCSAHLSHLLLSQAMEAKVSELEAALAEANTTIEELRGNLEESAATQATKNELTNVQGKITVSDMVVTNLERELKNQQRKFSSFEQVAQKQIKMLEDMLSDAKKTDG